MSDLYDLPTGWEWKELISLTEVFSDGDWIESKDQSDNGIRLIQTGNVGIGIFKNREDKSRFISESTFDRLNCTEIFEGDCLISRLPEPVGRSCLIPKMDFKLITSVDCTIVRFRENLLPKLFLYYSQSNFYFNLIMKNATGATRLRISKKNLSKMPIPLPPLSEQQRIVSKLDKLFEKIDKAIALHQKNMDEADVFMGSVLNDVFGVLEERYGKTPITNVMKISNKTLVPNDNEEYNYVGLENIEPHNANLIDFSPTMGSEIKSSKVIFKKGMVLYGKLRPYLNKVWISDFDGVATTEILPFYPIDDYKLNMNYVKYYFLSPSYLSKVMINCSGARMPRLTTSFIKSKEAYIPIAPIKEQQKVVSYLDEISQKIEKIKQIQKEKMESLKALKASILDQAFRGEF